MRDQNNQFDNWESLAEFSLGLQEDQDDIFLHCTRVTIDDRELLYLSEVQKLFEMVRTCPLVEFPTEYQDDIQKMKELKLPLSFIDLENFIIKDNFQNFQEELNDTTDTEDPMEIYEKPVLEYDTEFSSDLEKMKAMGLPLGFYNWYDPNFTIF